MEHRVDVANWVNLGNVNTGQECEDLPDRNATTEFCVAIRRVSLGHSAV